MLETVETLLITRNLPPLQGGMERLMFHTALALAQTGRTGVVGPIGCRGFLPPQIAVEETPFAVPWFHLETLKALYGRRWLRLRRVLAGSGLTAPLAEFLAWQQKIPYGVFVHGLDLTTPHWLYQRAFLPSIRRADVVIANSHATANMARGLGVPDERLVIVFPGVETAAIGAGEDEFRQKTGLGPGRFLLSAGRLTARKGLEPFIRQALPSVLAAHPEVRLVVVGTEPGYATLDSPHSRVLRQAAADACVEAQVVFLGRLSDNLLTAAYAAASAFVFPVLDLPGDLEGFGMVAIEAAAQGCPTVGFAVGGVVDAVSPASGRLVPAGDYPALVDALRATLGPGLEGVNGATCRRHAAGFGWDVGARCLAEIEQRYLSSRPAAGKTTVRAKTGSPKTRVGPWS